MEQNTEFEKYWHIETLTQSLPNGAEDLAKKAYQAATAEANKRIAELEGEVAGVREDLLDLRQQTNIRCSQVQERDTKIYELQANNHDLREALELSFNRIEQFKEHWMRVPAFGHRVNKEIREKISNAHGYIFMAFNIIQNTIATTPAESLQAHDDEVLERAARHFDDLINNGFSKIIYGDVARQIRALKEVK